MAYVIKSMTASIACNATLSDAIDLGEVDYSKVYVEIPTMSTAAAMRVYGAMDGSTYRYIHGSDLHSAAVGGTTMVINSAPNGALVQLPSWAKNMKFQVTGTVCANANIKVFAIVNT